MRLSALRTRGMGLEVEVPVPHPGAAVSQFTTPSPSVVSSPRASVGLGTDATQRRATPVGGGGYEAQAASLRPAAEPSQRQGGLDPRQTATLDRIQGAFADEKSGGRAGASAGASHPYLGMSVGARAPQDQAPKSAGSFLAPAHAQNETTRAEAGPGIAFMPIVIPGAPLGDMNALRRDILGGARAEAFKADRMTLRFNRICDKRVGAIEQLAILAGDVKTQNFLATFVIELIGQALTMFGGGVTGIIVGLVKHAALKATMQATFTGLVAAAKTTAATGMAQAIAKAAGATTKAKLFFEGLEEAVREETSKMAIEFSYHAEQNPELLTVSEAEMEAGFDAIAAEAVRLQVETTRRAWLVFQAQQKLGVGGDTQGITTADKDAAGGTRLDIPETDGTAGVLQVELNPQTFEVKKAKLPGLGSLPTSGLREKPLGQLALPTRFEVTESQLIFVNENGRAWFTGRGMEAMFYRRGGGALELDPDDQVPDSEWNFVEAGLDRVVDFLMSRPLGAALDL